MEAVLETALEGPTTGLTKPLSKRHDPGEPSLAACAALGTPGLASVPQGSGGQEAGPEDMASAEDDSGEAHVLELTLEDALRIALERNIGLEVETVATDIAERNVRGSWGSFDPVFSLTGTASEQERQGSSQLSGAIAVVDEPA